MLGYSLTSRHLNGVDRPKYLFYRVSIRIMSADDTGNVKRQRSSSHSCGPVFLDYCSHDTINMNL